MANILSASFIRAMSDTTGFTIMQEAPENGLAANVLYRNARCSIVEILPKD